MGSSVRFSFGGGYLDCNMAGTCSWLAKLVLFVICVSALVNSFLLQRVCILVAVAAACWAGDFAFLSDWGVGPWLSTSIRICPQ